MLDLIKKSKRTWTIGGLDDYRDIFNTFIYILYYTLFLRLSSYPPKKVNNIIKTKLYNFWTIVFYPPSSSISSKLFFYSWRLI